MLNSLHKVFGGILDADKRFKILNEVCFDVIVQDGFIERYDIKQEHNVFNSLENCNSYPHSLYMRAIMLMHENFLGEFLDRSKWFPSQCIPYYLEECLPKTYSPHDIKVMLDYL